MALLTTPTIHRNGSGKGELLHALTAANNALGQALVALAATVPNARDYYPQGPAAVRRAGAEHESRMMRVQGVRAEIVAIMDAVLDARGDGT